MNASNILSIRNAHISAGGKPIVKGISLFLKKGEIHVLMGPNGSGKSTLAHALMGHPRVKCTRGRVSCGGVDIISKTPEERARLGIFLAFQHPLEFEGIGMVPFLRNAHLSIRGVGSNEAFVRRSASPYLKQVRLDSIFLDRYLNWGFSGGEKKKMELLQMLFLEPRIAILDEIDSGVDIDTIRQVRTVLSMLQKKGTAFLFITHHPRTVSLLSPDRVYVMKGGKIAARGGKELVTRIEQEGYDNF